MFLWLYNACFPVVFLALLPGYLWRMLRRGDYRANFGQRLGWYSRETRARLAQGPPPMWLQAVSVGEMLVALKLVAALREQSPALPLILSTTTTTGFRLAKERFPADVEVLYSPVDLRPIVRRAFRLFRPASVVIVDGGLWPNQLWEAHRLKIPAALVNARLSPRSESRFLRFPRFSATIFRLLGLVCVSEAADVARWARLGAPTERIRHTGSIKYDDQSARLPANGPSQTPARLSWRETLGSIGVMPSRPVLLAGSTHTGEESILAEIFVELRRTFPDLFLIIAPRHVERTPSILAELSPAGLRLARRTGGPPPVNSLPSEPPDVLLLDTTGELSDWYGAATVVFIGKSLASVGGHNPAEAISAGKPVVVGPHMENFIDLTESLLAVGGILQVQDAAGLTAACARLLADARARAEMAAAGHRQLEAHRGAASLSASLLLAQAKFSA